VPREREGEGEGGREGERWRERQRERERERVKERGRRGKERARVCLYRDTPGILMAKETYSYGKRDLFIRQKTLLQHDLVSFAIRISGVSRYRPYEYGKRDLFIRQNRPIHTVHTEIRQKFLWQKAYSYGKNFLWQKFLLMANFFMAKGLFLWQMRPNQTAKEAYCVSIPRYARNSRLYIQ